MRLGTAVEQVETPTGGLQTEFLGKRTQPGLALGSHGGGGEGI